MFSTIEISCVSNDGAGASYFNTREVALHGDANRALSDQIAAQNFRLRSSDSNYSLSWHVAGDPTLLVILNGAIKIELRNGESKLFSAGDMFIAQDYLLANTDFDDALHGHRAEVVGDQELKVLHLKLEKRN